jgi:hypothetical protein
LEHIEIFLDNNSALLNGLDSYPHQGDPSQPAKRLPPSIRIREGKKNKSKSQNPFLDD